jgi:uncharacterized protein YjbI with pentapeptide repeats
MRTPRINSKNLAALAVFGVSLFAAVGAVGFVRSAALAAHRDINRCVIVEHPTKMHHTVCPHATLRGNLDGIDLSWADLNHANLERAQMAHAKLEHAHLEHAQAFKVRLGDADLSDAQLPYAYMEEADLHDAKLIGANLHEAILSWANLEGGDLEKANLYYTNLACAENQRWNWRDPSSPNYSILPCNQKPL